jgi:AraC family transcriptional regulator of adaptative response/methylated-DNA-[protein]-cysteine methyltransferase
MNFDQRWKAVLERDPRFDAPFVYAVSSTKVFCRPTCPSRRPARERVSFFDSALDAQNAGFRAYKRCHPLGESRTAQIAARVANGDFSSSTRESRAFEAVAGVSPRELGEATRVARFKTELRNGESVLNAGLEAGYGSMRAIYERAPSQLGMTPATYGKGGLGRAHSIRVVALRTGRVARSAHRDRRVQRRVGR